MYDFFIQYFFNIPLILTVAFATYPLKRKNMEKMLEKLMEIKPSDTKLDGQILFMEALNGVIKTPITISILNSLKELKGIKQNQLEKLKTKN
jgi:hypothetical protein